MFFTLSMPRLEMLHEIDLVFKGCGGGAAEIGAGAHLTFYFYKG